MDKRYDAVVVGSGFGGGTVALRLAQAGLHVCILERGQRWTGAMTPVLSQGQVAKPRPRLGDVDFFWGRRLWNPTRQRLGIYELRQMSNLQGLVGAGVGGGALVWARVVIAAPEWIFTQGWPRGITRQSLERYYQMAEPMLAPFMVPSMPRTELLRQASDHVNGRWSPVRNAAEHLGYTAQAEAIGAEVFVRRIVRSIEPNCHGYRVHFDHYDEDGRCIESSHVDSERVIVSAGTFGTNELLMRCKRDGLLPGLSDQLGRRFSTNGNVLGGALNWQARGADESLLSQPDIGSMIDFGSHVIEDYANPTWTAGIVGGTQMQRILGLALALAGRKPSDAELRRKAKDLLVYVGVGTDEAKGTLYLNSRGTLSLHWPGGINNDPVVRSLHASMRAVAESIGRQYVPNVFSVFGRALTYHPLGGCAMADTLNAGVVDKRGEVFGYPGLYIADGSIVPTAIGRNPTWTIVALAERVAESILEKEAR